MIHALFSAILALAMQIALTAAIAPPNSVTMKAINNAGAPIEIFWINPSNKEFVKQTPKAVRNGTESSINSFEGHDFIARFQKHIEGVETSWTKLGREEKVIITYDPTTNRMNNKQLTKLDEVKEIINSASVECNAHEGDEFTNCITNQVMVEMNRLTESKGEIKKYRDIMADRLTNYICNDPAVKPTKPMETKTKVIGGKQYRLDYFVDLPESKVYVINNFITPQQCNHLQQSLSPYDSAVVMTHDGTVEMAASSTKAPNQYRYYLDEEYPSEDVMMPVFQAAYQILGSVSEINADFSGQEPLEVHNFKDEAHYGPHCSGACTGEPFKTGARAATVIIHCTEPASGGTLSFPKADVILKPTMGSAVFISYKDSAGHTDEGYTEHMSCPVREGEKVTAVLHLREGVTVERPWSFFSPTGVEI